MKKWLYLVLASAVIFAACSDDSKDSESNNNNTTENSGKSNNNTNDGQTDEIDYNAFCNVIMGKACGHNISDEDMNRCVEMYKSDVAKLSKCSTEINAYLKCVSKAQITPCTDMDHCNCPDDDLCQSEVDANNTCMKKNYPENEKE